MIKVKLKRFIAMTMVFCLTILPSNAFATEINLENSNANVNKQGTITKDSGSDTFDDETTNVWQNGSITEEVRVNVDVVSSFTITIPKEIILNGNDGSATYKVKCEGDIAGDQVISVVPDASFTLNEDGGKSTKVTVTQNDTDFTYVELNANKEYDGSLSAPQISAGNWNGSFYFNIDFEAERCEHNYVGIFTKKATETENGEITYTCSKCGKSYIESVTLPVKQSLSNTSWSDINIISESGVASDYFNIGDEKELQIGSETYHIQILGFNHDDKSDGTGKAGITVGLKEIMSTTKAMNLSGYNAGGWRDSEMRTYLNETVYNSLPLNLQTVIKTVNKVSDVGNTDIATLKTTEDKLFLLSFEEVGFTLSDSSHFVPGQGTKYDYFTDDTSRTKKYLNGNPEVWWLRSANAPYDDTFLRVYYSGIVDHAYSGFRMGVSFAFCI